MNFAEYSTYDGLGLAELVAAKAVTATELAQTAAAAARTVDTSIRSVVELYLDRIEGLDERVLGRGPFRGVPMLIKDFFGHEKGRKVEFGSRLCAGLTATEDTHFAEMLRAAGLNIIGRSAAPEFSVSATTESVMFGKTSNPWRLGFSAGGSSGGAQAAVTAGIVPIAHGSDLGGSIRIPASWCGGVGFKPSRMRVSLGPTVDERGWGYSADFVHAKTIRDVATMLDCVAIPQVGDPFVIPRPAEPYSALAHRSPPRCQIGIVLDELLGAPVDPEVAAAVVETGRVLEGLGHVVDEATVDMGGMATLDAMADIFFFGFDVRLDGYAERAGTSVGPDTVESVILSVYDAAKSISPKRFIDACGVTNQARRRLASFFTKYDVWLSPTTVRVAEPWGLYSLSRPGIGFENYTTELLRTPTQFTLPHNIMGTPAVSLPLEVHTNGLPIGVQLAGKPAAEDLVLQLSRQLELAVPWGTRAVARPASLASPASRQPD